MAFLSRFLGAVEWSVEEYNFGGVASGAGAPSIPSSTTVQVANLALVQVQVQVAYIAVVHSVDQVQVHVANLVVVHSVVQVQVQVQVANLAWLVNI